ncbi:aldehyde oxidase, partial [Arthrobacter stackebrandtii]
MIDTTPIVGTPLDRVDGVAKVTGQARYAGEYPQAGLLHGSVVCSTIARGRVLAIDSTQAMRVPGVIAVLDHGHRPHISSYDDDYSDADSAEGSPFRPLFNDRVLYSGQPLALVVAQTLELARYAGSLIRIDYAEQAHQTDLGATRQSHEAPAETPAPRGDFAGQFAAAPVQVDATYLTANEHHNPMEPHAS